jgi:hypothetical protein
MAQKTDLYSILTAYASRNGSPLIDIDTFLAFLEKYAAQQAPEHPEWQKWTREAPVKFWAELSPLIEGKRCEIQNHDDGKGGGVYLCTWYADLIDQAYRSADDSAGLPFPHEGSLKFKLPADQVRSLSVGNDLAAYLGAPQDTLLPVIRLIFPEEFGSALVLAPMIPRKLLEASLLKVRGFLRSHGGRDYAMHKLPPQVTDREIHLRDILNQIQTRPLDCIRALEEAEDYANLFWACFCSLIKNDVRREKEREKEDIAAIQAAFLIEILNGFFKAGVMKERERELAFKNLETQLEKPPFLYTLDAIIRFTSSKGVLLLGQYTQEELESCLKRKTTEGVDNGLPDLLIVNGSDNERWFIKKKSVFPLIAKLLLDAKTQVKKAVERRWLRILTVYRKEPAMDNDRDFERLLGNYTAELCGTLTSLLNDAKLPALYRELELAGVSPSELSNVFVDGEMISFPELYGLKRKELLANTKILLPFWYSIPILVAIISLFTSFGKKKPKRVKSGDAVNGGENEDLNEKDPVYELRQAGREIEAAMVPPDSTLDDYLEELEDRWSRLLDKDARNRLVEDVKVLVRDHFRYALRNQKNTRFNRDQLNQMASSIIAATSALKNLGDQKSLHTYMVAYLTQLLLSVKF